MIYIGCDHAGYDLKQAVLPFLKEDLKLEVEDLGCFSKESVDYPDIAKLVCEKVKETDSFGILICGTGIGMSIYANKVPGIRCALCTTEYAGEMARKHNNANILALGGRVIGSGLARSIIKKFLSAKFEGGSHQRRIDKICQIQK